MVKPAFIRFSAPALGVALALGGLAAAGPSLAQDSRATDARIYQQRTPDGRTVLTDRPSPDATTERVWHAAPQDAAAAHQRREDARLEAMAVTERVQREIEAQLQRDLELSVARLRLAAIEQGVQGLRAADAVEPAVVYVVPFARRPLRGTTGPLRPRFARPAIRPAFGMMGALPG